MQRASYQLIIKKYAKRGKGSVRLTQSSLMLFQAIETNKKVYNFAVLQSDNQQPAQPEEIRLNLNDEFTAYEVGYLINYKSRVAGAAVSENIYLTYAPTEQAATQSPINNAWDARLSISVNNIVRLENWDMLKHKCQPRTQFQNFSAGIPHATQPSICLHDDGCIQMQPMLTFTGAKKNDIELGMVTNLTAGLAFDWLSTTGTQTLTATNLVLIFRGMLGQNAAVFQK